MRKLNVLFMQSQTFFGSDSMIHSLFMRHLDRSRYEVHAACNPGTPKEPSASLQALKQIPELHLRQTYFGPTVYFVPRPVVVRRAITGSVPTVFSLAGLAHYARSNKIDIIHCTEKPRDAFYGFLISRLSGARCVIHLHVKVEKWISPLVRWSMHHADGLIGVSDFVAQSAIQMGYAADRMHTVVNGLDTRKWQPALDGGNVRAEFGITENMTMLSIISRLCNWKGHTELLKALAKVKAKTDHFKLVIVGEDDPRATIGHGSYTDELKQLAHQLGITDNVVFTGFRTDIAHILAASDIYAMPSFEEPCAVAFIEALAMQKPVVALDSGGTSHLVEHGKSGLLSQYRDIDQLAEHILLLINNPDLRVQMGVYGRKHVEEYLTPQRMTNDLEQIYQRIHALPARHESPHSLPSTM